jgi:hypothetical protein
MDSPKGRYQVVGDPGGNSAGGALAAWGAVSPQRLVRETNDPARAT